MTFLRFEFLYKNLNRRLPYKRTIKGNSSEFDINGQRMSHKEYSAKLEELNIFINSKNFLVYQGKVEEIALKNAKERMHMFEEISESVQFKEDYIKVRLIIYYLRKDCVLCE